MTVNFRIAFCLIFGVVVEKSEIWAINIEKVVNGNQIHGELQHKERTSHIKYSNSQ
jgi:hypothetical protein